MAFRLPAHEMRLTAGLCPDTLKSLECSPSYDLSEFRGMGIGKRRRDERGKALGRKTDAEGNAEG